MSKNLMRQCAPSSRKKWMREVRNYKGQWMAGAAQLIARKQ